LVRAAGLTMRASQRPLCVAVAELTLEFRRPPTSGELARLLRRDDANTRRSIMCARRDGLITPPPPGRAPFARSPIRLTAGARIELGLPVVVYLAWPLPLPNSPQATHDVGRRAGADLAFRVLSDVPGAVPVSPYLAPHGTRDRPRLDAGAAALAAQCDAAIVYRDPILTGRPDVAAALAAGAHVVVIDDADLRSGDPWRPSYPPI
jgi:hypothetical protein